MNYLRFLRYFDEVARIGSIRQAAEHLHVAPSAINRRIQDLEAELGVPLFERLPRGMRLTAAGELFVHHVRSHAADLDKVRSEIEDLRGLRRGIVRLVASQALAPSFMPRALARFRRKNPLVQFEIGIGDHVHALAALRAFDTDLALVFNLGHEADVQRIARIEQRVMVMMHRRHPLAQKGNEGVRLRDCVDYPIALPGRASGGRQILDAFLARSSVVLEPTIESNSFEFLRGCLYHEHTLSFQIGIGAVSDGGEIVARAIFDRGFPSGELVLARLRARTLPVASHVFSEHLAGMLDEAAGAHA